MRESFYLEFAKNLCIICRFIAAGQKSQRTYYLHVAHTHHQTLQKVVFRGDLFATNQNTILLTELDVQHTRSPQLSH